MIHKLRRKFILINMSLVTLVLLIVFAALCFSTYRSEKQGNLSALQRALDAPRIKENPSQPPPGSADDPFKGFQGTLQERLDSLKPCAVVTLDSDGDVSALNEGTVSFLEKEELLQAVEAIRAGDSDGLLSSLGLRYLQKFQGGKTTIAFIDRSNELVALKNLFLASLFIGAGSLAAFFVISLFLSSLALRPVEKAWQQQQQFVADASHELKNPLTVILANLGILQAHPDDTIAGQGKWLANTREEALRMKKLVDDLLYLAKSDAGRQKSVCCQINASDVVLSTLLSFEPLAYEKGLTLDSEVRPDLSLYADAGQLKQLTAILLDNACKYAVPGSSISVNLKQESSHLVLRVTNQGPVIPVRDREHLFERFYRSDESRARQAGGYGLGLAIAASITRFHQGRICVERSDEAGTVFCVQLPVSGAAPQNPLRKKTV